MKIEKVILTNAFSINMITKEIEDMNEAYVHFTEIDLDTVKKIINNYKGNVISAIGHEGTAKVLSELTGFDIKANRINVILDRETALIVFQILERLPEGKILTKEEIEQLMNNGKIKFYEVELIEMCDSWYYEVELK